jgi:hypothetical protein
MLYQQLRLFAFMAVAMVGLSAGAQFSCDNSRGYIFCHITLNPGNDFTFSEEDTEVATTRDGKYSARVQTIPNDNAEWKISVLNSGGGKSVFCYDVCPIQGTCDNTDGACYYECHTNAC